MCETELELLLAGAEGILKCPEKNSLIFPRLTPLAAVAAALGNNHHWKPNVSPRDGLKFGGAMLCNALFLSSFSLRSTHRHTAADCVTTFKPPPFFSPKPVSVDTTRKLAAAAAAELFIDIPMVSLFLFLFEGNNKYICCRVDDIGVGGYL